MRDALILVAVLALSGTAFAQSDPKIMSDWKVYRGNKALGADSVKICLYRDEASKSLFSAGEWRSYIGDDPPMKCAERFIADLSLKRIHFDFDQNFEWYSRGNSASPDADAYCSARSANSGGYTGCASSFFGHMPETAGDSYRRVYGGDVLKAFAQARVFNGLEEFINRREAQQKAEKRERYVQEYEAARSLDAIDAFTKRYVSDDPEGLIIKLAPLRAELEQQRAAQKAVNDLMRYRERFAGAQSSSEINAFISDYAVNDPDLLVPRAKKRLPEAIKKEEAARQELERKNREEARQQEQQALQDKMEKSKKRLKYISELRAKYAGHVIAESTEAYRIVSGYKIDCLLPDRRVLPLLNFLYATLASLGDIGKRSKFILQNRGSHVRIVMDSYVRDQRLPPSLYYEINEWGELRTVFNRPQDVLGSCVGGLGLTGPIWLMPGEPGY